MADTNIEWADIAGFDRYRVSNTGLIVSTKSGSRRYLKARTHNAGYLSVCLRRDGKNCERLVHRLVADAFLGACGDRVWVNHINGDKKDNRACNLEWAPLLETLCTLTPMACNQPGAARAMATRSSMRRASSISEPNVPLA